MSEPTEGVRDLLELLRLDPAELTDAERRVLDRLARQPGRKPASDPLRDVLRRAGYGDEATAEELDALDLDPEHRQVLDEALGEIEALWADGYRSGARLIHDTIEAALDRLDEATPTAPEPERYDPRELARNVRRRPF